MKDYQTYLFDLDGTITNTVTVWLGIFRDGLLEFGITSPEDKILSQYTHDWDSLVALGLSSEKISDFALLAHKLANERLPKAPLHAGSYEFLESLKSRGKRIGIFSTMDAPMFEPAMQYRNLNSLVHVAISGTDVTRRKPYPDGILKALQELHIPESEYKNAVYIGDRDTDLQAATNAGIDGVLYFPPVHQEMYDLEELKKYKPAYVITDWNDLLS